MTILLAATIKFIVISPNLTLSLILNFLRNDLHQQFAFIIQLRLLQPLTIMLSLKEPTKADAKFGQIL